MSLPMSLLSTSSARYQDNTDLQHLPGGPDSPWLNTVRLLRDPRGLTRTLYEQHGPIFRLATLTRTNVALLGPDANQLVLLDKEKLFSARLGWMPILEDLFPNGLMLRDLEDHLQHRRIMQVAFRRDALVRYLEILHQTIESCLKGWESTHERLMYPSLKALTLDIAARTFLGVTLGEDSERINRAFQELVNASMSIVRVPWRFMPYGRGVRARAFLEDFIGSRIAERRRHPGPDMFSQLCAAVDEEGKTFTDQEVIDHTIFLLMAAHDTLTSALSTLTYELARHPEWQERVRACCEQQHIASGCTSLDILEKLEPVDWCLKEALRLNPPLMVIQRRTVRAFEFGGYSVPERTPVVVDLALTHRLPSLWTEPDRFDPERFSPARAEDKRHRYGWIPFGGGAHMCIGMVFAFLETRLVIAHLLHRFRLEVPVGYTSPFREMPISMPRDLLPMRLVKI